MGVSPLNDARSKACPYCSETILFDAIKCRFCGEMLSKAKPDQIIEHRISTPLHQTSGMGITAFVLSIVGLFFSFIIPFLIQIISLILGHIALSEMNNHPDKYSGRGLVVASLVINYCIIGISFVILFAIGYFFAILF
ncbi:MAG: DUF4190 domain-containing protein [Candidatus Puniceispirillales bacterium]